MIPVIEPLINMLANMAKWLQENKEFTANLGTALGYLSAGLGLAAIATLAFMAPWTLVAGIIMGVILAFTDLKDLLFVDKMSPWPFFGGLEHMDKTVQNLGTSTGAWFASLASGASIVGNLKEKLFGGPDLGLGGSIDHLEPDFVDIAAEGDKRGLATSLEQQPSTTDAIGRSQLRTCPASPWVPGPRQLRQSSK